MKRITLTLTPITQAQAAMVKAGTGIQIVVQQALSAYTALVPPRKQIVLEACTALQGPPGPQGPPGDGASTFEHTQATADSTWTVNHNLGFRPAVTVLSPGGLEMLAEVLHTSLNQALVYFDAPKAGNAICS